MSLGVKQPMTVPGHSGRFDATSRFRSNPNNGRLQTLSACRKGGHEQKFGSVPTWFQINRP